jgi:hypothetical protein
MRVRSEKAGVEEVAAPGKLLDAASVDDVSRAPSRPVAPERAVALTTKTSICVSSVSDRLGRKAQEVCTKVHRVE